MSFSYSLGLETTTDQVRLLLGDTIEASAQFQNEEVAFFLTQAGGQLYQACGILCQILATRYSAQADKQVGDLRLSLSQKSTAYAARKKEFDSLAGSNVPAVVPYAGGQTYSDKLKDTQNPDLIQPYIRPGQMSENDRSRDLSTDVGLWRQGGS